jgi:hypothetical protein
VAILASAREIFRLDYAACALGFPLSPVSRQWRVCYRPAAGGLPLIRTMQLGQLGARPIQRKHIRVNRRHVPSAQLALEAHPSKAILVGRQHPQPAQLALGARPRAELAPHSPVPVAPGLHQQACVPARIQPAARRSDARVRTCATPVSAATLRSAVAAPTGMVGVVRRIAVAASVFRLALAARQLPN